MNFFVQHTVLKYFTEGLWRDEAFSWAMASRGLDSVALTASDFNPPLYYLLLHAWMRLFGSSEMAMRSLSVLFFAATLWIAWRFMEDLLAVPRRRCVVYLLLFALNPLLAYFAVEARMYSLFAFLAATSFYAHQAGRPVLYIASTTAGLYTHSFMGLVVLVQVVSTVLSCSGAARRRRMMLLGAPLLLFVPWLITMALVSRDPSTAFWIEPSGWRFGLHVITAVYTGHEAMYGFLDRPERWMFALCLLPCVLWTLWAGYRSGPERRPVFLLLALWALLPPALVFAGTVVKPMFLPRYLIFSTVGLLLLLVYGLERARLPLRLAMLTLLAGLAVHYQVLQAHRHTKGVFRETVGEIRKQAGPRDLLYVRSEFDFFPAQYYFDEARVFVLGRTYAEIWSFAGKVLIPPTRVVSTPTASERAFLLRNEHEYVKLGESGIVTGRSRGGL
jgi:uncharacterized membrane protein